MWVKLMEEVMISKGDFSGCNDELWEKIFNLYTKSGFVEGRNIDEVWRSVMYFCILNGYDYLVEGGSYVGQIRKQLHRITIEIHEPWLRPLAPLVPNPFPAPTTNEGIEEYFLEKLMSDKTAENEIYTYGLWIVPQLEGVIKKLNDSRGNTNQACISVGDSSCIDMEDPPCLRTLSFKVVRGRLVETVFFRSWDLVAGLPENLGGMQLLKEYVLSNLTFSCEDGPIIANSDGLHIYSQYFDLVDALNTQKIQVDPKVLAEKMSYEKKYGV